MNNRGNRGDGVAVPVNTRYLDELMDEFDALPLAYCRVAREAAYNVDVAGWTSVSVSSLRRALRSVEAASVLATYGPDHPHLRR